MLFFQLGLILALFTVWQLIEWKVDAKETGEASVVYIDHFEDEPVPITEVPEEKLPEIPREPIEK